jgi:DMSO/TMAO reductase YedYZ molybdopterin-dependent catalytic subunit
VIGRATSGSYRLVVAYGGRTRAFSREDLLRLPQTPAVLPIACVEGWSASGTWTGVRMRTLLDRVGAPPDREVTVVSLQESGPFTTTVLPGNFADDDRTLLALTLEGEPLSLDHGYPARIIAPNRPGVLQTKWVRRVEVRA